MFFPPKIINLNIFNYQTKMSIWRIAVAVVSFHLMMCKSEKIQFDQPSFDQSSFGQNQWQLLPSTDTQYNPDTYYLPNSGNSNNNNYYQKYDESFNEIVPDKLADKNFKAPEVATATTGGLGFISYALRGIAWLFVVGTLFLMFVGTVSAAFYR